MDSTQQITVIAGVILLLGCGASTENAAVGFSSQRRPSVRPSVRLPPPGCSVS